MYLFKMSVYIAKLHAMNILVNSSASLFVFIVVVFVPSEVAGQIYLGPLHGI